MQGGAYNMGYQAYDQSGMNGTPGYGSHATGGYAASGYDQGAPQGYATAAPQAHGQGAQPGHGNPQGGYTGKILNPAAKKGKAAAAHSQPAAANSAFNDQGFLSTSAYSNAQQSSYSAPAASNYFGGAEQINRTNSEIDDEPPLLEELGIHPGHIIRKTLTIIHPLKKMERELADDQDLCGPIIFALMMGAALLLRGKIQFGYILGFGAVGCLGIWFVLNLLSETGLGLCHTVSILGYCLLPMVGLAFSSLFLNGVALTASTVVAIIWCSSSAARMVSGPTPRNDQGWLVAYPVGLLYTCFALLTIF